MKTIFEYIKESKQNFLVKGHTKEQRLKNRLCDFLQFYIDCSEISNAPKDIFTLSKVKLKSLFSCTSLPVLYTKPNKYYYTSWKNYNDFYDWLMEHKNDEIENLKETYNSSNKVWSYHFEVNSKPFNLKTKKSFTKQK